MEAQAIFLILFTEPTSRNPNHILQRHIQNICAASGTGANKHNLQHPTSIPSVIHSRQGNAECNSPACARNQERHNLQKNESPAIRATSHAPAKTGCAS